LLSTVSAEVSLITFTTEETFMFAFITKTHGLVFCYKGIKECVEYRITADMTGKESVLVDALGRKFSRKVERGRGELRRGPKLTTRTFRSSGVAIRSSSKARKRFTLAKKRDPQEKVADNTQAPLFGGCSTITSSSSIHITTHFSHFSVLSKLPALRRFEQTNNRDELSRTEANQ
jgi:hypothetical protein